MKMNPFKQNGEMLPVASLNSLYVDDVLAYDLFRPALILQDIINHKEQLGITSFPDNVSLLAIFNDLLNHDLDSIKTKATDIAIDYGNRLAKILSTLFRPSLQSVSNRKNWNKEHWDYWKSIRQIYMVGGLTSPILTKIFYQQIITYFSSLDIQDVQVRFIEGSQNLGTSGLATLIENGSYLLFDFGQTSIKRAYHVKDNNQTVIESFLEPLESKHLFYKTTDSMEIIHIAKLLDDYIISVIKETISEVDYDGNTIYISIANYVSQGVIYKARGGYGKLAFLEDNYQNHLQSRLSEELCKDVSVKLFHDTSAMALLFTNEPHTAVISLGTAFGVAFPE